MCLGRRGVPGEERCDWGGDVCLGRRGVPGEEMCAWGGKVCKKNLHRNQGTLKIDAVGGGDACGMVSHDLTLHIYVQNLIVYQCKDTCVHVHIHVWILTCKHVLFPASFPGSGPISWRLYPT